MEPFMTFFEQMPAWERLAWVVTCLLLSWLLEAGMPLFRLQYRKWRHAMVNLALLGLVVIINLVMGLLVVWSLHQGREAGFGLFFWVDWSPWVQLILTVLLLDFMAQYFAHYLLHRVKWMWRLHMVHHSDTKVDATTGTRHHPGDFLIRELFSLGVVLVLGAPIAFYLFYRFLTIFFTYFTHANIDLPLWLDKSLSLVFVTPHMHKFHHHFERPWTDTNFGNVFSIWDRLFGTFVYDDPRKIVYGLDVLDPATDEDLAYQLRMPFDRRIPVDE
jgi:sterol desaturase/sphingolipid hydroxylase (fatty acid hydroxylase superfamily)